VGRDMVAQKIKLQEVEMEFLCVTIKFGLTASIEHKENMFGVLFNSVRPYDDIVQIDMENLAK
jgi:hypothetical protein